MREKAQTVDLTNKKFQVLSFGFLVRVIYLKI